MSESLSPVSSTPLFDQFGPRVDFAHPITMRKDTLIAALEAMTVSLPVKHRPEHWSDYDAERLETIAAFIRSNSEAQARL
jgi:hypothetical protein